MGLELATEAAASTSTAATKTAGFFLSRTGFINNDITAFHLGTVELFHRCFGLFVRRHLHEAETAAAAGELISDDRRGIYCPEGGKKIAKLGVSGTKRKTTDK